MYWFEKVVFCWLFLTISLVFGHDSSEEAIDGVSTECSDSYKYPDDCKSLLNEKDELLSESNRPENPCSYEARWSANQSDSSITFIITTKFNSTANSDGTWYGIGFNKERVSMSGLLDIVLATTKDQAEIKDYNVNGHKHPEEDKTPNVEDPKVQKSGDVAFMKFDRKLSTSDAADVDLSSSCVYFIYPIDGGPTYDNGSIKMHTVTPIGQKVCVCNAGSGATGLAPVPNFYMWFVMLFSFFYLVLYS